MPASWLTTIDVSYKVCIDVPIESYLAARVPVSENRIVGKFFNELKHIAGWRIWEGGQKPDTLDGDVVAANNKVHPHAAS